MAINVYLLLEVRNLGTTRTTVDVHKICPTYEDALDVYRENVGEPKTIREDHGPDGLSRVWFIDEDATGGSATITRYTLNGNIEEA